MWLPSRCTAEGIGGRSHHTRGIKTEMPCVSATPALLGNNYLHDTLLALRDDCDVFLVISTPRATPTFAGQCVGWKMFVTTEETLWWGRLYKYVHGTSSYTLSSAIIVLLPGDDERKDASYQHFMGSFWCGGRTFRPRIFRPRTFRLRHFGLRRFGHAVDVSCPPKIIAMFQTIIIIPSKTYTTTFIKG